MQKSTTLSPSACIQLKSIIALLDNVDSNPSRSDEFISSTLQEFLLQQLHEVLKVEGDDEAPDQSEAGRPRGYVRLSADERMLVENLRWTRHKGRDKVYRLAQLMRSEKPWCATI